MTHSRHAPAETCATVLVVQDFVTQNVLRLTAKDHYLRVIMHLADRYIVQSPSMI